MHPRDSERARSRSNGLDLYSKCSCLCNSSRTNQLFRNLEPFPVLHLFWADRNRKKPTLREWRERSFLQLRSRKLAVVGFSFTFFFVDIIRLRNTKWMVCLLWGGSTSLKAKRWDYLFFWSAWYYLSGSLFP